MTNLLLSEIRTARSLANASMKAVALEVGWSESRYRRFESGETAITIGDVAAVASVLGLQLGAGLHPVGDGLVDRGHQALLKRFRGLLAPPIRVASEVPLIRTGARSWDLLLRIGAQLVGVEAETRVRDAQALVRKIRVRERDGGADAILVVLSDSAHNRAVSTELREMLGPSYATSPRAILAALRAGRPLPGSGVILV